MLELAFYSVLAAGDDLIRCVESIVFAYREDLRQSEMTEKGLCAEIRDAEKIISLTEEKCTAATKQILEMSQLERTEKEGVKRRRPGFHFRGSTLPAE